MVKAPTTPPASSRPPQAKPEGLPPTSGREPENPKFFVFDLFTGMGGCWHAFSSFKTPPGESFFTKTIMFETDETADSSGSPLGEGEGSPRVGAALGGVRFGGNYGICSRPGGE